MEWEETSSRGQCHCAVVLQTSIQLRRLGACMRWVECPLRCARTVERGRACINDSAKAKTARALCIAHRGEKQLCSLATETGHSDCRLKRAGNAD
eukprot:4463270-Pleurochrysis_carterae.AAC.1